MSETEIQNNMIVTINYTIKNSEGELLETTLNTTPLTYFHGKKEILPSLEKAIDGRKVNESFMLTLKPNEAYGELDKELIKSIDKQQLGNESESLALGMRFRIESENGQQFIARVIHINETEIIVDGNHPFAGETLHFSIDVTDARKASNEEISKAMEKENKAQCCSKGSSCC